MNQYVIPEAVYLSAQLLRAFPALKIGSSYYAMEYIVDEAIALGDYSGSLETDLTNVLWTGGLSLNTAFKTHFLPQSNLNSQTAVRLLFNDVPLINEIGAIISPDNESIELVGGTYDIAISHLAEGQNSSVILKFNHFVDGIVAAETSVSTLRKVGGNREFTTAYTANSVQVQSGESISFKSIRAGKAGYANTLPDSSVIHIEKVG